jgi:cytoskeletal protein CcmA (bactofilin family)
VQGNLVTPNLMIEKGSFFEGHCAMSQQVEPIVMTEAAS